MENIIVIDTDIIINHVNQKSSTLSEYITFATQKKARLIVSVITIYEFYSGQSLKDKIIQEQSDELFQLFTIQEINPTIARLAAKINRERKLYGKIGLGDLLIGTTALYFDAPLLTRNKHHFQLIPNLKFSS